MSARPTHPMQLLVIFLFIKTLNSDARQTLFVVPGDGLWKLSPDSLQATFNVVTDIESSVGAFCHD